MNGMPDGAEVVTGRVGGSDNAPRGDESSRRSVGLVSRRNGRT